MKRSHIQKTTCKALALLAATLVMSLGPGAMVAKATTDSDVVDFSVPDGGGQQTCILASPQDGVGGCTMTLTPFGCSFVSDQTITIAEPVLGTITLNVQIKSLGTTNGGDYSVIGTGNDDGNPVSVVGEASDACVIGRATGTSSGELMIESVF